MNAGKEIVRGLRQNDGALPISRNWGVVKSIQTSTITVTIGGSTTQVAGVKFLGSYCPVTNDVVMLDVVAGDLVAVGPMATATGTGRLLPPTNTAAPSGGTYIAGDHAYDTGYLGEWLYDGSNWKLISGAAIRCQLTQTTANSINNSSDTKVALDTIPSGADPLSMGSTTNHRITVPVTGWYRSSGGVRLVFAGAGHRIGLPLYISGSLNYINPEFGTSADSENSSTFARLIYATANQYLELFCFQDSGGALNTDPAGGNTWLDVSYVGP